MNEGGPQMPEQWREKDKNDFLIIFLHQKLQKISRKTGKEFFETILKLETLEDIKEYCEENSINFEELKKEAEEAYKTELAEEE